MKKYVNTDKQSLCNELSKVKQSNAKLKDKLKHNEQQIKKANTLSEEEISKILSESTVKLENQMKLVNMLKSDKESLNKKSAKLESKIKDLEQQNISKDEELQTSNES